ncbi:hypothetical protein Tco_1000318 [Tanacetum coccineum]
MRVHNLLESYAPSSLVTPPPINRTVLQAIPTSLLHRSLHLARAPFTQLKVARLEQDISEVKKTDHSANVLASIKSQVPTVVDKYLGTKLNDALLRILERHTADLIEKYSMLPGPESIKNQESEKSPKEIIIIKKEQGKEKQDSTYSIRSTDKVALEEFDLKTLIADEDAMDKEVKDRVKNHKRKHDNDDDEDDDDDEGPSAGSNKGKKKLCKADLEGPTFNLVKAFHKNNVFLQYQMDECHKLLTNKRSLLHDNIIPKPDLALELGKSISLTEAEEEAVAREVHATHARIVSGPDPEPMQEDQTGSNSGKLHVSLAGPNPEHMDDEFLATAYPKVHENLKLITDKRVIEENPESHSGSVSSMKNLDDTYNFGDQFLYDKPTEDDQEKSKVIEESDSTIPDPSHQTVTSTPPVIAPFTDVSSIKPSSLVSPPPINTEATTITTSLLEITPFIALQLRVARLEQEMSEVKKTDHSADVLASIKSQVPTVVDEYLGTKLDDALLKILE